MDIDTTSHIFPRTDAEALALSTAFKGELKRQKSVDPLVDWLVQDRQCMGISDELRDAIASAVSAHFGIDMQNVVIVGSARLGFSVSEKHVDGVVRPRYRPFTAESDIDVAVIDSALFDEMWRRTFLGFVASNRYYARSDAAQFMFKGWFRPDKLPYRFPERNQWFDFFKRLSAPIHLSDMSINAGLYKSADFLSAYQRISFNQCLSELKMSEGI